MILEHVMILFTMKHILGTRKKKWDRFQKWEVRQGTSQDIEKTFHLIGEWVDFFLSKHPNRSHPPDVRGIKKMHQSLSRPSDLE